MTPAAQANERRHADRFGPGAHDITAVRIRPGHSVALVVNASVAGALLETSHRLLPGAPVDLQVEGDHHRTRLRARVIRCAVADVRASAIQYRGAVVFERHLPWFHGSEGYRVPNGEQRGVGAARADATREAL